MTQEVKVLVGISIATIIILIGGVFYLSSTNPQVTAEGTIDRKILVVGKDTQGPSTAKVTVVEFADYQCPACGAFHPQLKKILSDYNGKIYFVYRNFPLSMHKNAPKAAQAAQAALAQNKFWEMHDLLFENQSSWSELENPLDTFVGYAKILHLDEKKFKSDVENDAYFSLIEADMKDGQKAGVSATPTVFVNGKQIIGVNSIADLADKVRFAIDAGLSGK